MGNILENCYKINSSLFMFDYYSDYETENSEESLFNFENQNEFYKLSNETDIENSIESFYSAQRDNLSF